MSMSRRIAVPLLAIAGLVLTAGIAVGQARHPFAIGGTESGAPGGAFGRWLMAEQASFTHAMTAALRDTRTNAAAFWSLLGLSFGYGVFHAAGPGHGKAVMASYMFANERALRRGLLLTAGAALMQAAVAIALVVVLRIVIGATAARMTDTAVAIEIASYGLVATLGAWLVWRKGLAFVSALGTPMRSSQLAFAGGGTSSAFTCEAIEPDHLHDAACGHFHAPDAATLGDGFSWREAGAAMAAAGARPCSGAVVVLVFALAQDLFAAGIAAALAMAAGTALTTGALAILAVHAKRLATRLAGSQSARGVILVRGLELLAALAVFTLGAALLFGSTAAIALA